MANGDDPQVAAWMKSGHYLPKFLRDFHDQKDVFKAVHHIINVQGHEYCDGINFKKGQCYVIDIFLWFMARRGYTLQRARHKMNFRDLDADVEAVTEERRAMATQLLKNAMKPVPAPEGQP